MSTKTNFKRIALVAVAALGMGVLSSVPSQAASSNIVVSAATNGTATTTVADSTTAGTVSFTALAYGAAAVSDTVTVTLVRKIGTTQAANLSLVDTASTITFVDTQFAGQPVARVYSAARTTAIKNAFLTETVTTVGANGQRFVVALDTSVASGYIGATFRLQLDSAAANANIAAGTYDYTVVFEFSDSNVNNLAKTVTRDISIVVGALATDAKTVNGALSSVTIGSATGQQGTSLTDSTIATVATASTTTNAFVLVRLRNAAGGNAQESITATITAGTIGNGTVQGRSVILAATAGNNELQVKPDGTAGTAVITISTPSYTFPTKTVTFYSSTTGTVTAATYASVIGASGIGVMGTQSDATGISFGAGTSLFAYSADTSTISSFGSACTWNSTAKAALCTLTGVKNGTTTVTLRDAATVATSTKSSSAISVKVNINAGAKVALAFDKPTYAPGERATVKITVTDAAGAILPAQTFTNLFATGGLTTTSSIGNAIGTTLLSNVTVITAATIATAVDTPLVTADPIGQVSFYMPAAGATVTVTGKGGTALPADGQVTVSATATVTDAGAAALAAVNALSTAVASLKTLITTLTNLVLKIQKKVKA